METPQENLLNEFPELSERNIQIESILGRGGMGTVYRGKHLKLDRTVAVKIINPESANNQDINKRFEREAKLMAKLRHPNAAMVYDFGTLSDGRLFIVMEFIEGETLSEVLEKERRLSYQKVVDIAVNICDVLAEAHSIGIVHRDLKPANIMLNEKGVFVLDFGIAKMLQTNPNDSLKKSMTAAGTLIGTPYYMSPEQCLGEKLDGRSDLYSLGALIYEMLSGRPPFDDEVFSAIIIKHATTEAMPLKELSENVPQKLSDLVKKLLEKKPEDRPANALVAKDLLFSSLSETEKATAVFSEVKITDKTNEAATKQMEQETVQMSAKTFANKTEIKSEQKKSSYAGILVGLAAIAVLAITLTVGGYWFGSTLLNGSETAKNNSNSNMVENSSKTNDPYSDGKMDHSKHTDSSEPDYANKIDESTSDKKQSVPLISSEEADKVLKFITNTTYHRADGVQIIKTPTDSAIVCLHNMIEQGKTHLFVVERPNPKSQWQVSARASLDVDDFKSANWNFEPEDVDGDGFEEVIFSAETSDTSKRRVLIYVPRNRQNYWAVMTNVNSDKPEIKFSPNAELAKAESFKKRLERGLEDK